MREASTLEGRRTVGASYDGLGGAPADDQQVSGRSGGRPSVYLAAPYTSRADERTLPSGDVVADQLPTGSYRSALTRLADTIATWGVDVVLPHRDISGWGATQLPAGEIARQCAESVQACDVVIALLATSFGTHVEVGVALGAGIPVIALWPRDTEASFFASGLASSGLVTKVEFPRESELPDLLDGVWGDDVRAVVHRAVSQEMAPVEAE